MSASQNTFNLNEAIEYALKNNYDHKNQLLDNAIMAERIKEVISLGLPNINGSVTYRNNYYLPTSIIPGEFVGKPGTLIPATFGTSNNIDVNLDVQQLIFDGRYMVGLQARKAMREVAIQGVKFSETEVRNLIKKTFFAVLMAGEGKEILKQNRSVMTKSLEDNKKIFKEGLIEELDIDRLTLSLANLDKEIALAEGKYELALVALKFNMGYQVENPIYVKDSLEMYFRQFVSFVPNNNFDIKNRIEFQLINSDITLKGYDVKQQKAGYYPSFVGFFNTGTQALRKEFNFFNSDKWFYYGSFGVRMNIPIWDGNARKYSLEKTKIGVEKSKIDLEKFQFAAKSEAIISQINFKASLRDYKISVTNLELAKKINNKAKIMFSEGIGSSFELSNSESELVKSTVNLLLSKYGLIVSKIDYDKAVGTQ